MLCRLGLRRFARDALLLHVVAVVHRCLTFRVLVLRVVRAFLSHAVARRAAVLVRVLLAALAELTAVLLVVQALRVKPLVDLERLAAVCDHASAPRQLHRLRLLGLLQRHHSEHLQRLLRVELELLGQLVDDLLDHVVHRRFHTDAHTALDAALHRIRHVELGREHIACCFCFASCLLVVLLCSWTAGGKAFQFFAFAHTPFHTQERKGYFPICCPFAALLRVLCDVC